MLHHLSIAVSDLARSARFYDAVLSTLGYRRVWTADSAIGYGIEDDKDKLALKYRGAPVQAPSPGFHLALAAPNREAVARFHELGLAHGGTDNGVPGLRAHYGPTYFAAFVIDPDGYALEAVCKDPS
ncbi:MAG: VOC family protein [Myxococcota bacterium]